ncbi:MAG: bifunctional phosphoribosyl-AMP cyclohydrolase/phosphoribosyl-ATP diphosphatase HisIE [Pseudomonadota bacterium]
MIPVEKIQFQKLNGLIPACIQHVETSEVLMIGFMNREAVERSIALKQVTFWSRSRNTLWTKGETSGNILHIESMTLDCDQDSLLIEVTPAGPTCHAGTVSCFPRAQLKGLGWYANLSERLESRLSSPKSDSYTSQLIAQGERRLAQKVGEEGLEVALGAVAGSVEEFIGECADLLFHSLLLLKYKKIPVAKVTDVLRKRFLSPS